jgi:hypothetical protein
MRFATILFALLLSSADALAQVSLGTALRDAQRLAQCMMALDSPCVIALSDIHSYQLLSTTAFDFAKKQTHYFDVPMAATSLARKCTAALSESDLSYRMRWHRIRCFRTLRTANH